MIKDLYIFETKTDAVATNRGFYYQYLKTLIAWLDIYLNNSDSEIYCETDDDIKKINSDNSLEFNQIKCYSSNFSLSSIEIKKSICNFFILFAKNQNSITKFYFETNSGTKDSDKILQVWNLNQFNLSQEHLLEISPQVEKILIDYFEEKKENKVKSFDKNIKNLSKVKSNRKKSKNDAEIEFLNQEKVVFLNNYSENINNIKSNLNNFIQKVGWFFSNEEADKSITNLTNEAILLIEKIPDLPLSEKIIFHRLLSEVFEKGTKNEIKSRKLDNNLLLDILKETKSIMESKSNSKIVDLFLEEFKNINSNLKNIDSRVKTLENSSLNQNNILCIPKVNFEISSIDRSLSYFEGKSARPQILHRITARRR
ncbi:MAG: dsDNA nuclease domain-containing protein [Candidatus Sericytochromatia bacterium]